MSQLPDTYEAVRAYLYGLKHRGALYGIDRMEVFSEHLGFPHRAYPVVHVAGTNGKGSTCAMLEAIFRRAGYRTGLFTSPHLVHQGERVQVDRRILTREAIVSYTRKLKPVAEAIEAARPGYHPTFFEFMTGMAFLRFAEAEVDVGIIETGLGGRLDATNVVDPELTAITSISLDHTEILGDSLEAIAREKAGIIKPGKPVVLGLLPPEAEAVIRAIAAERGAPVHGIREWFGGESAFPPTALPGAYQRRNAAVAAVAAHLLAQSGRFRISEAEIAAGLLSVNWAGRWEHHALLDRGIILAGRKLLDSIIDVRTPRMTMIIRNAFGGAYASWNSHFTGADRVFAMPMARIAVMGPAGKEFVYKDEFRALEAAYREALARGDTEVEARRIHEEGLARLNQKYEHELMNPKEALSLGSVSSIVMPGDSRRMLGENLAYLMRHYRPEPMSGVQREHE